MCGLWNECIRLAHGVVYVNFLFISFSSSFMFKQLATFGFNFFFIPVYSCGTFHKNLSRLTSHSPFKNIKKCICIQLNDNIHEKNGFFRTTLCNPTTTCSNWISDIFSHSLFLYYFSIAAWIFFFVFFFTLITIRGSLIYP